MDPLWLTIAFILGFAARLINLPPMVGFLIAGFILNAMGAQSGEFIEIASDLGVTILLFTIGLKLKIKKLLRPEIIGGALSHMALVTIIYAGLLYALSFLTLKLFTNFNWSLSLLIAFALSFSSTVFAVKALESKGETGSLHGRISIGILIIQDLLAVIFLVFAADKIPTPWVLTIPPILFIGRYIIFFILKHIGHGEMLILFGFFLALIPGAYLFKAAGLKADLGALVLGMVIAGHPRAKEMAESLFNFKDFFLIAFFLSIGLSGVPDVTTISIALILALGINIKVVMYFLVLTRFRLRSRTSLHTSLTLANFSEFGLIIAAISMQKGWLPKEWLVTIAIALSISFIVSAPINIYTHRIYALIKKWLNVFESSKRLYYDTAFDIGDAGILIFGMGHLGAATYDHLNKKYGQKVLGLDYDEDKIVKHKSLGRNISHNDATDSEFWEQVSEKPLDQVKIVLLCLNSHKSNLYALERLKAINYKGLIGATAKFEDEKDELKENGVDLAYNLYTEAGIGFADEICLSLEAC